MTDRIEVGRLAFRVEGHIWNCYWAPQQDSMNDAVLLGSIAMSLVQIRERKDAFMALMRDCFADAVNGSSGSSVTWGDPEVAPEHERSGSA